MLKQTEDTLNIMILKMLKIKFIKAFMISGKNNGKINSVYIHYSPHLEGGGQTEKVRHRAWQAICKYDIILM